jgi:hypothetical protein
MNRPSISKENAMKQRRRSSFRFACVGIACLAVSWLMASVALAAAGPVYVVKATWGDTNLPPGGSGRFVVQVGNLGDASGDEAVTIVDHLPAGVTASQIAWTASWNGSLSEGEMNSMCSGTGTGTVTCVVPADKVADVLPPPTPEGIYQPPSPVSTLPTGYVGQIKIDVEVAADATGTGINSATISEGDASAVDVDQVPFSSSPSEFGVVPGSFVADVFDAARPFGEPSRRAGDHPFEQRVDFDFTAKYREVEGGGHEVTSRDLARDVEVTLPRGMIGNPEATPKCDPADFAAEGASGLSTACPANTQVGYIDLPLMPTDLGTSGIGAFTRVPIYNLVPPGGVAADFAFNAVVVQGHIYPQLDPSQNYAIKTVTPNISSLEVVRGAAATFWGVPGDPAHDRLRVYAQPNPTGRFNGHGEEFRSVYGAPWGSAAIRPLLTNPSDCGFDNGGARIRVDSYSNPGQFTPVEEWPDPLNVSGCEDPRFRFEPELGIQPSDRHAGAPTGLDVHLKVPQRDDEVKEAKELYAENGSVKGISTPPLKRAVVTFPEGMTLSPSAAQGLGSCSPEQISLGTNDPVACPDNSQYGTLTLHTPILPPDNPPKGFIYIAQQGNNPFHNFLSIYLVIEEPERGILVKIPGRLDLDPQTGQITTTFDDLPQFPVSDLQMTFKGGARAGLVQPSTCGTKTIRAEFFSWQAPNTPQVISDHYTVSERPDGSPCLNSLGERAFRPVLEAGMVNPIAGAYSPFVLRLARSDEDQEFSQIGATLPSGLAAKFAGVGICPDAGIAQAAGRSGAGQGSLELLNPSCPASAQIGTTEVGTGVGTALTWVPGKVYLAGPYRGAPMSMVVISPAIVGPYDLGVIAVRTALHVDPETAQARAASDPFPQIFQGIPVRIRDIRLQLDRPGFTLNPTSCTEKQITAHVTGTGGDVGSTGDDMGADLRERFQVSDCASLGFKPKLSLRLFGGTKRGSHPKLRAVLKARKGDANIAFASVSLPHSEFLDQAHIGTVCTRVQFAARACPARSVYGHAIAKTPLFDSPLQGPVYLRSSDHPLPDLVAVLRGPDSQPVEIDLDGRIDSHKGGIRNTFSVVPDAPVSEFTLAMSGGRKGLLVNSTDLCRSVHRAAAKFTAQNGRSLTLHPRLRSSCGKGPKARKGR